ncbi:MAG TPA: STAS domain-containing protein [Thermoleophilaceae bacterium]|nr:STAS domain-containing protein [Thermoleophilaceae bacterium]
MANRLVGLDIEEREDIVVAHVSGELDIAEATVTGESITAAVPSSARGLVVDFSELTFIDSSGIAMLFQLVRQMSARRQLLGVVARADEPVSRVLEIVEFERAAPIHRELDAAIAGMDSGSS